MNISAILTFSAVGLAQAASADQSVLLEIVSNADHQIEIYIADEAPSDFGLVLDALYMSDVAISLLVSPEVTDAVGILRQANDALDFLSENDPPTLCILKEAVSVQDILVVDHITYKPDFKPEKARVFIGAFDGAMEELVYPASSETAEFMEGLSGTCSL